MNIGESIINSRYSVMITDSVRKVNVVRDKKRILWLIKIQVNYYIVIEYYSRTDKMKDL